MQVDGVGGVLEKCILIEGTACQIQDPVDRLREALVQQALPSEAENAEDDEPATVRIAAAAEQVNCGRQISPRFLQRLQDVVDPLRGAFRSIGVYI